MRKYGQRAAVAVVAVALSTVGFAGSALAFGNHEVNGTGGSGGSGGHANANCLIPVGVSAGVLGQGGPVDQCNASGGVGGSGGSGIN